MYTVYLLFTIIIYYSYYLYCVPRIFTSLYNTINGYYYFYLFIYTIIIVKYNIITTMGKNMISIFFIEKLTTFMFQITYYLYCCELNQIFCFLSFHLLLYPNFFKKLNLFIGFCILPILNHILKPMGQ